MEEFLNLNWLWKTSRSTPSNLYARNFSDDEKDIFLCHLNEIDHVHLLDSYGKHKSRTEDILVRKDPRTGQEIIKEVYDHSIFAKPQLFANFSQRSSMNSSQHQSCLNAIAKLQCDTSNASMSDRLDIRTYAQLSMERNEEKTKFLEFVRGEFYQRNIKNCYNLLPELNKFIMGRWKDSIKNVLTSNNDNCYQLQSAIPISQSNSNDDYTIEYEKTINQTGTVLAVNCKKYSNPMRWSCSYLKYFFPTSSDADTTAPLEELMESDSLNVVISLTTLASILTTAKDLSIDWNITFTLKECEDKKTIIFDEILPSPSLQCLEKNRRAYKYGVTATIAVPKKKTVFCFAENRFIERIQPTPDKCSTSILLQEPISEYKVWDFEEYLNKFSNSICSNNGTAGSAGNNHIRRLWNIKRNNVDYCRLVIDNSQDFCEKQIDGSVRFMNLSPKIEYQCDFGAEQMSISELITEWCELRFGHNTITHRVRIDVRSGCVLETKEITIADVEQDLRRLYQVKTECLLEPLFKFMEIIKQFPPNEYMLRHLEKHSAQVMVYVKSEISSTNTTQIADIYKSHKKDTSILETIPWSPIDDTICTAIHIRSAVMPCAFPHWGEQKKAQSNDRLHLVKKAAQKDQEKSDAISKKNEFNKKRDALKKQRAKQKKKLLAKRAKLNFEGESLDPNELFDERGNVLGIASHTQPKAERTMTLLDYNEEKNQSNEECTLSASVSFDTYCRDAAVISDDSIDP